MSVTCFLPCRKGSERIPGKNVRPIAGREMGLLEIKIEQLLGSRMIDRIILSTNDEEIINYAEGLGKDRLEVRRRAEELASSSTSTDELIDHVGTIIRDGHILWTHVTSPFFLASDYDAAIRTYFEKLEQGYDSLMSVTELKSFLWDDRGPVNYDRAVEKWPRTQTLGPLYEVNSAAFLAPASVYRAMHDRIGSRPYKYVLSDITGFDIDWEEDFLTAEAFFSAGFTKL